ncbi:disulfide bond formation protein B [Marivivens niveibacter]|uniref:Disulfide bond formation protein B n=1 Tax=Marivivens niveibacter TaxID=1930667 RepID=A0A251X275_9RHOB|nr:disulfide bond formation protein B [Marivivens niveibacter]OUD10820.1 disulfide bond formation protein B [Marivivens niveibacter]
MTLTRKHYILIAAGGSALTLFGAMVIFQRFLDLPPCAMCIWQRWPHAIAIGLGVLAYLTRGWIFPALGAISAAVTAGIGLYHFGVEHDYWEGPSSCTSGGSGISGMSTADLLSVDSGPKLIMCDQISWELFGISMPGWNAIVSIILVYFWIKAIRAS